MVESTLKEIKTSTNYDDPVYAKFKNVLKGAVKVTLSMKLYI